MNFKTVLQKLSENKEFKKEYQKEDLAFELSQILIEARIRKGLTQDRLAKKMGTKQTSIARVENGKYLPSLNFLNKIAKALGTYLLTPKFAFMERENLNLNFKSNAKEEIKTFSLSLENKELSSVLQTDHLVFQNKVGNFNFLNN